MTEATKISAIFENVMGWTPSFNSFEERLEMQKIIYLLYEIGASCGDFSFRWHLHGPYSQKLQNVMISSIANTKEPVSFSEKGEVSLARIRNLLNVQHNGYSDCEWLEALGSILYLTKHSNSTDTPKSIVAKLEELKSNLNISELNNEAFNVLENAGWFSEF